MTAVNYQGSIYMFGGRAEQTDIQKVFKLKLELDEGVKFEKCIKAELEPVGNLSSPGTNLKVFLNQTNGLAYVFGNIPYGVDVYDLKKHRIEQTEQMAVFQQLLDPLFQSYTVIF